MKTRLEASKALAKLVDESIGSLNEELINLLNEGLWDERVLRHLNKKVHFLETEYAHEIEQLRRYFEANGGDGHTSIKKASKALSQCAELEFRYKFLEEYQDFLCEFIFSAPKVLEYYRLLPD